VFYSLHSFEVYKRGFLRLARVCQVQITLRAVCGEVRSGIANLAFWLHGLSLFRFTAPGSARAPGWAGYSPGRAVGPSVGWCRSQMYTSPESREKNTSLKTQLD
jgi:hypothetical protein